VLNIKENLKHLIYFASDLSSEVGQAYNIQPNQLIA